MNINTTVKNADIGSKCDNDTFHMAEGYAKYNVLTRGRTEHFSTKHSTDGTVSLPPAFTHNASQLALPNSLSLFKHFSSSMTVNSGL